MSRQPAGRLCPVCLRPAPGGRCRTHGTWRAHQLLTRTDRRRSERERWHPFTPRPHACPRCLGDVMESRTGFECLEHADGHGPYRVDELLLPTAQRESAASRRRLARRSQAPRREPVSLSVSFPDPARSVRVLAAAGVVAATLAFLVR